MNAKLGVFALLTTLLAMCAYAHEECTYCDARVLTTAALYMAGEKVGDCDNMYPKLCKKIVSAPAQTLIDVCDESECAPTVRAYGNETNGVKCDLCKIVVSTARRALTAQYTVEAIEQAVHNVCNKAAGFKDVCDIILETGVKTLIEYIRSYTDDNVVCAKVRLC